MRGTLTNNIGLVHAVRYDVCSGYRTQCLRLYVRTPLDSPVKTVTCLWCVTNQPWPASVTADSLKDTYDA